MPRETVVITGPHSEVCAFAADPGNLPEDNSNSVEFSKTGERPVGGGTTYRVVANVAGRSLAWTSEVLGFEEGCRRGNRSIESPMAYRVDITSRDADDGPKLMGGQETADFGGFFAKLADASVIRMYRKDGPSPDPTERASGGHKGAGSDRRVRI